LEDRPDVGRASEARAKNEEQTLVGHLGLREVIVDVVVRQDLLGRGNAGLSGTEDDSGRTRDVRSNEVAEGEARVLGLHHDVDEDGMKVRRALGRQNVARFGSALRMGKRDGASTPDLPLESEPRDVVNVVLIIDDENIPGSPHDKRILRTRLSFLQRGRAMLLP
jgi:hypothetical protein